MIFLIYLMLLFSVMVVQVTSMLTPRSSSLSRHHRISRAAPVYRGNTLDHDSAQLQTLGSDIQPVYIQASSVDASIPVLLPAYSSMDLRPLLENLKEAAPVHALIAALLHLSPKKLLTDAGLVHATTLGLILWSCSGVRAWTLAVVYFVLGSAVTKFKLKYKQVFLMIVLLYCVTNWIDNRCKGQRSPSTVRAVPLMCGEVQLW
jgi:hypothetical protein